MKIAADTHCAIGKIRFKRHSRYRSPSAFNVMTSALLRGVSRQKAAAALLKGVRG